jgi:hypothetical protein
MGLVTAMESYSTGVTSLDVLESYKIAVPASLGSETLDTVMTFCSNNSHPVVFNGLPKDRCGELLGTLIKVYMRTLEHVLAPINFREL